MLHYFRKLSLFKYFVFLILSFLLSAVFAVPILGLNRNISAAGLIFITSAVLYLAMLILIWYLSLTKEDRQLIWRPAPSRSRRNVLFILAPFLWSLPINIIYVLVVERFFPDFYEKMLDATNLPQNFIMSSDAVSLILLIIAVVIFAPIVEEIVFRGILYNLLNKWIPLFPAALISSAVFGLLHGTTFFQTAAIGLVLAFVYQATGDLKVAMLGHAVNNGLALVQGILLEKGIIVQGQASEVILSVILMGSALAIIMVSVIYLRRNPLRSIYRDRAPMYKHEISRQYSPMGDD